jgi:hypothetical protein
MEPEGLREQRPPAGPGAGRRRVAQQAVTEAHDTGPSWRVSTGSRMSRRSANAAKTPCRASRDEG